MTNVDNEIKAIETSYNGYKFRSRLEARWAVFFDEAAIRYEYETEGYVIDKSVCYLPDFYLPDYDTHVEVKADTERGRAEVLQKCGKAVDWGGPIKQLLILSDIPEGKSPDGGMWHFPVVYWSGLSQVWGWWFFHDVWFDDERFPWGDVSSAKYPDSEYICFKCGFRNPSITAVSDYELRNYFNRFRMPVGKEEMQERIASQEAMNGLTYYAFRKARASRFEFGEAG